MSRRTTPQSKKDDRAFPVRLLVYAPELGLGRRVDDLHQWLMHQIGRGNYGVHTYDRHPPRDKIALYFRHPSAAVQFVEAFPDLTIADDTLAPDYNSPDAPAGGLTEELSVCNLYDQRTEQAALASLFAGTRWTDRAGNVQPGHVYPDQLAPIVRHDSGSGGLELAKARWGMPSPKYVLKTARDPGVTNVRNVGSSHWRRWLGPAHRCLVPVTAFAETREGHGGNQWFVPAAAGTPMFFAGIEVRGWRAVRKIKDGETTDDLFAFLTCQPNAEVKAVHPKAMPVILTKRAEWDAWLSQPFELVQDLQRPLPDGSLVESPGPVAA